MLDDVKRGQITALIGAGSGMAAAAWYVGCSVETIRREAVRNDDFRQELRTAEVRGQLEPLQAMRRAASTHWRAAAWLLERSHPQQFDRRHTPACKADELHAVVEAVVEGAVEEIADPDLRERLCRRLLAIAARATRRLTAADRARLDPKSESFDMPTTAEQQALDSLMADIDRRQLSALRMLKQDSQNPFRSA